jgi:hypothetical protein
MKVLSTAGRAAGAAVNALRLIRLLRFSVVFGLEGEGLSEGWWTARRQ